MLGHSDWRRSSGEKENEGDLDENDDFNNGVTAGHLDENVGFATAAGGF